MGQSSSLDRNSGLIKSLGPGIILAGACIGGSHLMSSTTAGAKYGFALLGLILITNLIKYPFLLVGTRFTAVTGKSLLEGFQETNPIYLPLYVIVGLVTGTFTISAVSFVSGLLLTNIPIFNVFPPMDLAIGVLMVSGLILIFGKYKALDKISKILVALLTLLTAVAVVSLLLKNPTGNLANTLINSDPSPWELTNLAFLIPLMGWMPGPVELCVWPSLWMFSRAEETNHVASIREAEFDFNLGYIITVITAIFFVTLGALTMYGEGSGMMTGSGISFAQNLINLYTDAMGGWAKWVIVPAAFAAMFSTTLTCLDAYPRSISASQGLLLKTNNSTSSKKKERDRLRSWTVIHILASLIALLISRAGGVTVKDFVFGAMTGSFLSAPLFAWMALNTINSKSVPSKYRYRGFIKFLSWFGLIFLSGFSLLFIANTFFNLG